MFEFNGDKYELHYTIGRLKLIEKVTGQSAMALLSSGGTGMISLTALESFMVYGLKEVGADAFLPPKAAGEIFDGMLTEQGYAYCVKAVTEALMKDVPFLFRVS